MAKKNIIKGKVFIAGDNIDTDQIIPAQYLNLVPTIKDEYQKLGSYALCGLPDEYKTRYIAKGKTQTEYPIVIGGNNFGCGSSREHAPISLGAAGCTAVVAKSFARIFFRNCIATGEVYPVEINDDLNKILKTGDEVEIDLDRKTIKLCKNNKSYPTRDLGAVKEVIDAGGIFNFARKSGMIK
jgi:3-isopropylmalate/(R)-2-methylmalate dehydratase small subunit